MHAKKGTFFLPSLHNSGIRPEGLDWVMRARQCSQKILVGGESRGRLLGLYRMLLRRNDGLKLIVLHHGIN